MKCFSRDDVIKCKIRLYNKSKQAIFIKAGEFEFVVNGEKYHCDKTHFVVEPDDIADRMVEITTKNLKQDKFEINTTGIYTINDNPEVITMPDTKWPSKHGTEVNGAGLKCYVITNRMHPDKSVAA